MNQFTLLTLYPTLCKELLHSRKGCRAPTRLLTRCWAPQKGINLGTQTSITISQMNVLRVRVRAWQSVVLWQNPR